MSRSSFGKFKAVLEGLEDAIPMTAFTLPVVIVIGDESVGKSSLLENITKCAVFPRATTTCTRCPVRLQLRHSSIAVDDSVEVKFGADSWVLSSTDKILRKVEEIMNGLPAEDISETELVIKITRCNIPTFEYIDLPGVRTYPANMAARIHSLVNRYLAEPNTLVLCVIPASTARITSTQALGWISANRAQARTILALTKPDKVGPGDFDELIIRRLDGSSDELNVGGGRLAYCVAIKNRLHEDAVSLDKVDEQEFNWWKKRLGSLPEAHAGAITPHVGLCHLVRQVDRLYHDFICRHWKPAALQRLEPALQAAAADVEALGPLPQSLTVDSVLKEIKEQLKAAWPEVEITALVDAKAALDPAPGSREWAEDRRKTFDALQRWWPTYLQSQPLPFLQDVLSALNGTFNNKLQLRLERFSELKAALNSKFVSEYQRLIGLKRVRQDIEALVLHSLVRDYSLLNSVKASSTQQRAKLCVDGYLLCHVCLPLLEANFLFDDEMMSTSFSLRENDEWASNRTRLTEKLAKLRHAYDTITTIEQAVAID